MLAVPRVLSHLEPLGLVERRGLAKDCVGHSDLPDVVEERAELERDRLLRAESEFATEPEAEGDDALRVAARLRVALVELRVRESRQSLLRRAGRRAVVLFAQKLTKEIPYLRLVVNDQNVRLAFTLL